ncbi:MAG: hypothetical protein WC584_04040 [Candidatus Pacearchaeota archaeon]
MKNINDWYPPSKYVFYPLYKFYRKNIGLNMYISNFAVWASSAALHAAIFLPQEDYTKAKIVGGVFLGLGILSTGVKILKHKPSKNSQPKSLDDIVR